MADNRDEARKLIRKFLNPTFQGKGVEAIVDALSVGGENLIHNVEAVNDNLYIVTATGRYLEQRLADRGIVKPPMLGLDDDTFREIGIEISNRKVIKDLINNILEIIYGSEYTRGMVYAERVEPYHLKDGDKLYIQLDEKNVETIIFTTNDFQNIYTASAQEVADAISKKLRQNGSEGSAFIKNDGLGNYVVVSSPSSGASSTIRILGGRAQNEIRFPAIKPTTGDTSTQWNIEVSPSGTVRMTWTAGPNPSVGKVNVGDYVNIFGSGFNPENEGTFTITKVKGGSVGKAFVEFENPIASDQITIQGSTDSVLFFYPEKKTLLSNIVYAAAFQSQKNVLEVFLPAITRVVRRERIGAAHIIDNETLDYDDKTGVYTFDPLNPPIHLNSDVSSYGSYVFDINKPYQISKETTVTTAVANLNSGYMLEVGDSSEFPDKMGFVCLGFGTEKEEGPIPYLSRPSNKTLLLSPSYKLKYSHKIGTDVSLMGMPTAFLPDIVGRDYPLYSTDTSSGREYAKQLIKEVTATGLNVVITILYPDPTGLSKWDSDIEKDMEWRKVFD